MGYTTREMEKMATDRKSVVPWPIAYATSEQKYTSKGINMDFCILSIFKDCNHNLAIQILQTHELITC